MQTRNLPSSPTALALKLKRYSCKQCKRCFRNRSGLTQHTHAKHPHFSPPPAPFIPDEQSGNQDRFSPVPDVGDPWAEVRTREEMDDLMNDESSEHSDDSEHSDGCNPAVFVGQDDTLFHNYHPSLTGEHHIDICFIYQGLTVSAVFSTAMQLQRQFFAKWNPTRTMPGEAQGRLVSLW